MFYSKRPKGLCIFFFSFTLYLAHNRVIRRNLLLRNSIRHFPLSSESIERVEWRNSSLLIFLTLRCILHIQTENIWEPSDKTLCSPLRHFGSLLSAEFRRHCMLSGETQLLRLKLLNKYLYSSRGLPVYKLYNSKYISKINKTYQDNFIV